MFNNFKLEYFEKFLSDFLIYFCQLLGNFIKLKSCKRIKNWFRHNKWDIGKKLMFDTINRECLEKLLSDVRRLLTVHSTQEAVNQLSEFQIIWLGQRINFKFEFLKSNDQNFYFSNFALVSLYKIKIYIPNFNPSNFFIHLNSWYDIFITHNFVSNHNIEEIKSHVHIMTHF